MCRSGAGLALTLVLSACGAAPDASSPLQARLLGRDDSGAYGLVDVDIATLTSARAVRGSAARVLGGGSVFIEEALLSDELLRESGDDVQQATLVDGARPPRAQFDFDSDVLVPADWESLLMLSLYHHTERALTAYRELGFSAEDTDTFLAYANVRVGALVLLGAPLVTDNAAYAPLADALLFFPASVLDEGVPLSANEGVVAHELLHGLKHRLIHGGASLPIYIRDGWSDRIAINSYRADDEGLADFFAAVITDDPDFLAPSFPGRQLDRNVAVPRRFSQRLYESLADPVALYDPYPLGSALASWLWAIAAADVSARRDVATAVIAALGDLAPRLDGSYRLYHLLDAVMARALPELHDRGCAFLDSRLDPPFRQVPSCGIGP